MVFSEHQHVPWWQKLCIAHHEDHFGHVSLINPVTDNHAIVIEPNRGELIIELREFEHTIAYEAARIAQITPVLGYVGRAEGMHHISNYVPSCVSIAKVIMGIRCNAVTPKGLYKALLKRGALKI